jgi:hypothetical protein
MVIAQGSKPELAIEPNVLSCDAGIFQPQTVTFFADWSLQKIASFCFTAERSEWGDSMEGTPSVYQGRRRPGFSEDGPDACRLNRVIRHFRFAPLWYANGKLDGVLGSLISLTSNGKSITYKF